MADLIGTAPELEMTKVEQIAALPLGGRIRVDAWAGTVELSKAKAVPLLRHENAVRGYADLSVSDQANHTSATDRRGSNGKSAVCSRRFWTEAAELGKNGDGKNSQSD